MKAGARPWAPRARGDAPGGVTERGAEVEAEQARVGVREREAWAK